MKKAERRRGQGEAEKKAEETNNSRQRGAPAGGRGWRHSRMAARAGGGVAARVGEWSEEMGLRAWKERSRATIGMRYRPGNGLRLRPWGLGASSVASLVPRCPGHGAPAVAAANPSRR